MTIYDVNSTGIIRDYDVAVPCELNSLFTAKTYIKNTNDPNLYDVNMVIDNVYLTSRLTNYVEQLKLVDGNAAQGSKIFGSSIGFRLLEIVALNLYNHAGARAAITNDSEFLNQTNTMATNISSLFINEKNNIFEQYKNAGNVDTGIDTEQIMDFTGDSFAIKIELNSNINTSSATTNTSYPSIISKKMQLIIYDSN
jgi:hypothetical protein